MRIAMVSSECNPFCKTGGLADVVFALSKELVKSGQDVRVFLPYYSTLAKIPTCRYEKLFEYEVDLSWRKQKATIYKTEFAGVTFYFIGNDYYFLRGSLYGFSDDGERFAFFTMAVEPLFGKLGFAPDVIHVHDWQPGMLPLLIKARHHNDPTFSSTKTILTIHNPEFKGMGEPYLLSDFYNLPFSYFEDGTTRFHDGISTLKTAIMVCDKISTVSPTHREELLTPLYSRGMDGPLKLREQDFVGILNGVDGQEWNPKKDIDIASFYSQKTLTEGKWKCREALLESAGFDDKGGPVFGIVSRLTSQKGIHLVAEIAPQIMERGGYLFVLGSGESALEGEIAALRRSYPESCSVYFGYNSALAHKIYAGSDFFLMPSLFEPCGIGQMIAEAYGTLPVARSTGGLSDTIIPYAPDQENRPTGFLFRDFDLGGINYGIECAFSVYADKKKLKAMRLNAMKVDHGWKKSAEEYLKLYQSA